MRRHLNCLALTAALSVLPLTLASAQRGAPPPPLPTGSPAPPFQTKTLAGKTLSLRSLRGHVVLLDYWATWCGPCREATPTLEALHAKFAPRGLRVVGISVDDAGTVGRVPAFAKAMHVRYTLCAFPPADLLAAQRYNAEVLPSQYLIDKKGVIQWSQGFYSPKERPKLSALIVKLLAEKP